MTGPLMPKATAVWLVDNTGLTFDQIGALSELHPLEVQALADGDIGQGIKGRDPIANGELTKEEIDRCEADPNARLVMSKLAVPRAAERTKGPRYTPVAKRQDKPDGIPRLVRNHTELSDSQIIKLIGTTKTTIAARIWSSVALSKKRVPSFRLKTVMRWKPKIAHACRQTISQRKRPKRRLPLRIFSATKCVLPSMHTLLTAN